MKIEIGNSRGVDQTLQTETSELSLESLKPVNLNALRQRWKGKAHLILHGDCQQMPLQLDYVRLQQYGSDFLRIRHTNSVELTIRIAYQSIESTELIQLVFQLL